MFIALIKLIEQIRNCPIYSWNLPFRKYDNSQWVTTVYIEIIPCNYQQSWKFSFSSLPLRSGLQYNIVLRLLFGIETAFVLILLLPSFFYQALWSWWSQFIFFSFSFFYCCAGWGYIVAFTKVLTIYQIYHSWIHPLHHSPLPPQQTLFEISIPYG
jgi:hypothetical protein